MPIDRRSFFAATAFAGLGCALGPNAFLPQLYINEDDWLPIPRQSVQLEIVGETEEGQLPNLDIALIAEAKRVLGITLAARNVHNVNLIDGGVGIYSVYIWACPTWKKYRLWNFPDDYPPDHLRDTRGIAKR